MPAVRAQRPLQWHSDAEFGRQAVAGANPCIITAVTQEWIAKTGFTDASLAGRGHMPWCPLALLITLPVDNAIGDHVTVWIQGGGLINGERLS